MSDCRLRLTLVACVALLFTAEVVAQSIDGVLVERGTDRPIATALVTLLTTEGDSVMSVLTDSEGRFRVQSPHAGEFRLAATSIGYTPTIASSVFVLTEGGSMSLQFRIQPLPIILGGISVEAQSSLMSQPELVRNGFVDRVQRGFGRFITPGDIERSSAYSTTDLLSRTGRVTTRYQVGGDRILMFGSRGYCTPLVYLDGVRISISDMPLDAMVPISILHGAEVYRSANEAPAQFGGGMGGCGVIVLWTGAR